MANSTVCGWSTLPNSPLGVTHDVYVPVASNGSVNYVDPQLFLDVAQLPASRIRQQCSMILIETAHGTFDWRYLDNLFEQANAAGIRLTFPLRQLSPKGGGTCWASEASPCETGGTYYYGKLQYWIDFACAFAQRYNADGGSNNAIATDGTKRKLWVDSIEIGNEDFDVFGNTIGTPGAASPCRNPMRVVEYTRAIVAALHAPRSATSITVSGITYPLTYGGGNWNARTSDNFPAWIGMYGSFWHYQPHITDLLATLNSPPTDATYNPGGDHSSVISLLTYLNFHNYVANPSSFTVTPYTLAQELKDFRSYLDSNGYTKTPVWITEFGMDGPCGTTSEATQSAYFAANSDGTGSGALQAARDGKAQHVDIWTCSYNAPASNGYSGDPKSIACKIAAGGYKRFQAYTTAQKFILANPTWPYPFTTAAPQQGSITAPTPVTLASPVNLTTDGSTGATLDWAHWGLASVSSFDHKASVTQQIQNYTSVGSGTIAQDTSAAIGYTWNTGDGTPDSSATATTTGIKVSGVNNGFSFTVPIPDASAHTLNVYVGASLAQGQLRASFNDGVTPDYVDTSVNATGGALSAQYTLTYQALSAGTLTVTWTCKASNAAGSYVSLQSADIPGGTPSSGGGSGGGSSSSSSLTGSVSLTPSSSITLTTDGGGTTADWSHWGYVGTQQDHKSGVTSLISDITVINNGSGVVQQNPSTPIAYSWSDGTPDASVSSTTTGVQMVLAGTSSGGGGGGSGGSVTVTPTSLSFTAQAGGASPATQNLLLSNTTAQAVTWTSSTVYASGSGWLTLTQTSGTLAANTTQTIGTTVTTGALTAGNYTATVTYTIAGTTTLPVSVSFAVSASSGGGTAGLLPGQVIYSNGISNFLFGTNNPNYGGSTITTNSATQTMIKNAGFTVMRLAIPAGSSNSTVDTLIASATNSGCVPLVILIHNNASWNSSLVTYLGARCLLYEFGNEPDLYGGYTAANYFTDWSANIPTLRGINPSAAFIGPVMGVYANLQSWLSSWLKSCATSGTAGMMPDGISYHIYPCTGDASQSDCAGKATNIGTTAPQVNSWISSILAGTSHAGKVLPLCMTEWNIDANGPPQAYTQNAAFCNTWYPAAIESMAQNGFALACQFDASSGAGSSVAGVNGALDMIDTGSGSPHVSWSPITSEMAKLQPSGGGGTPPPPNPTSPHIAVVMMENRSFTEVKNNTTGGWTHLSSLINTYGYCSSFYGTTHPSLPNYIALTCGSTKGITNDSYDPSANPITGNSLFDSLDGASVSWKAYVESLPSAGYLGGDSGNYFRKHNPVVYYANFRNATSSYQQAHLVPYGDASVGLQTDLTNNKAPAFLFIAPNETDDGHGNPYQYPPTQSMDASADTFVNGLVTMLQASNWYTQNHGKILLVWDEGIDTDTGGIGDANPGGGHSIVVCISAATSGQNFTQNVNHYGVLRTIETAYSLPYLGKSSNSANGDLSSLLGAYNAIGVNLISAQAASQTITTIEPRGLMSPLVRTKSVTLTSPAFAQMSVTGSSASNVGNGFSFTTLADTTLRTLNVYVDVSQGTGSFTASLLDGSGTPDYHDSSLTNTSGVSAACYTLQYQANAPGQALKVTYTLQSGASTGNALASDTFDRSDNTISLGTASDGETWVAYPQQGASLWGTHNQQGVLAASVPVSGNVALLGTQTVTDAEGLITAQVTTQSDLAGLILRASPGAKSYYQAALVNGTIRLVYRSSDGVDHILTSTSASYHINTAYNLRFRIVGTTLSAKYWPNDGTQEPSAWNVTATDKNLSSGQVGIRGYLSLASDTVTMDTYSVTSLVASAPGASGSPNGAVTLHAASMPGTPIVVTAGALSGTSSTPSGSINLTNEGVNDWAAWGFTGASSFDHKAGVTSQLSTYTSVGSGSPTQGASGLLGFTWSDGTPDGAATGSTTESDVQGVGNGFRFTVPADTTSRTLYVYCGVNNAQGQLTATLSDGSASAYSDSSLNSSSGQAVIRYALTYNAASANQTLTVTWTMLTDNGSGSSTTTLASDTFARANQSKWGTASDGTDTWVEASGALTPSIVSNKGRVTGSAGQGAVMLLGTGTQTNGEATVRFSMSATGDTASLVQRANSAGTTYYEAYLQTNVFYLASVVTGARTTLASTSWSSVANTLYHIRFRLSGSTLYGRIWADGSTEPSTWTLTVTDSTNSVTGAGQYGVRGRIASNSDTVQFDSYTLTTIPGGGTPGSLSLGAATLVGASGGSSGGGGGTPPPPPPTTSIAVSVDATHPLPSPWLGYGVEQDAYDHGTGVPIGITATQRATINSRLGMLNPAILRTLAGNIGWWCPSGTPGTYTFTSAIMQEWYAAFDNAQANNIPVIVGVISPSPFAATNTAWCTALSDLLNYLINTLNYTCIQYTTGLSEPDNNGLSYTQYKTSIEPALVSALAANNLTNIVTLIGPDTSYASDTWLTSAATDLSSTLGGYARHAFPNGVNDIKSDLQEVGMHTIVSSVQTNDGKVLAPVMQTEVAYNTLAPGVGVTGYQYGLEMLDEAVQLARAGMATGIAWILDDDMHNTEYGLWGIVNSPTLRPWYFGWHILCNSVVANSTLYTPTQPASNDFRVVAAQSPSGGWTFVLVNRQSATQNVTLTVPTAPTASYTFEQYVYSNAAPLLVDSNGYPLPSGTVTAVLNRGMTVSMAGNSALLLTQQTSISTTSYDVVQPPLPARRTA